MNSEENNTIQMRKQANMDFRINRPYGIRIDLERQTIALFNRKFNALGKADDGNLDALPVEPYRNIEDIPHSLGLKICQSGEKVDLFFYDDKTVPFGDNYINLQSLIAYNKKMLKLSALLDRAL